MARSLNRVQLIGNLTRDPELRYTPTGAAVCTFSIATNRSWTTDAGEKKEESDFHRIVAWNKLAELCSQFLVKGRKVYVEGRLSARNWTAQDGTQRTTVEVVIDDMILLDYKRPEGTQVVQHEGTKETKEPEGKKGTEETQETKETEAAKGTEEEEVSNVSVGTEEVAPDDIPF